MEKISKELLLIGIGTVAFFYRFALMTMNVFPPGSDIGLHESVIKTITSAPTNFFWNNYHMGGGLSVTNPGYHIFAAFITTMTTLPDYVAQAMVASLFSALIVLSAFLITRHVWSETAAFVVAVLTIFSVGDIYMLSWGGYPNIIALMLIPIVFYLFLQPSKLSSKSVLAVASILVSALFLTHVFSALIFLVTTIFALLVCTFFWKKTGLSKKQVVYWLIPLALGALLVSPYLFNIIPVYFSSEGTITGAVSATNQAVLQTRLIPLEIIGLSLIGFFLFFVVSKLKTGKFMSVPTILFASWMLVPALATQSYLFGLYLDYDRFLYFLAVPAIVCIGLIITSLPNALYRATQILQRSGKLRIKLAAVQVSKRAATTILVVVLIVGVLFTPLFSLPTTGISQANYFQVMNPSEYKAIQWVKTNTPPGSVCVADAEFGWWLSGFAQRPTLSAVSPQYLILNHEVAPAAIATNLLTADYLVDNGLIQIKQEGSFANGNNHEILGIFNDSYLHPPVFSLNDTQISMLYRENGSPQQFSMTELNQTSTKIQSNQNQASFEISRENQIFRITEEITISRGVSFAQVSFILQNKTDNVNFDWLHLPFQSRGLAIQYDNSIGFADTMLHQMNQMIFPYSTLGNDVILQQNPDSYELIYSLYGNPSVKTSFFVGTSQFSSNLDATHVNALNSLIETNSRNYLHKISDQPLNSFDYQTAIQQWNISYIALRDFVKISRFTNDPMFMLVFKNDQMAIFKIVKP